ncbi:hypothetical protein [Paenacidovorax monticola]|uniref:Uncharacterized protein n=1 Tax=Paenacidovorax monticola TaxID=1926868 RepID=A0A7H0HF70_9BURK|nr:hypothetical protein [Paenacidovorax monticola]QNP59186.1 hypothetical protein H9L24_20480 [Paenacidovorax monticola]
MLTRLLDTPIALLTLLRTADRATYHAKHGGRNRAHWSAPEGAQARPVP